MTDATLTLRRGGERKSVALSAYLAADAEERAHQDAYAWIKSLRRLPVDGATFRERFLARSDSLWWFTEIYLHKQRVILDVFRTLAAVRALHAEERPEHIEVTQGSLAVRHVVGLAARSLNIAAAPGASDTKWWQRLAALDVRARQLTLSAYATRDRFRRAPVPLARPLVAAFIHRAFWKEGGEEGSAESYIGPVLQELEARAGANAIRYVGIGPRTNFRERRRWALSGDVASSVIPVERYAPMSALRESRRTWRHRYAAFRTMTASGSLRDAARIQGIDCWPLVREQLAGVAWLQWPWSVRAMDESGAALDALSPASVLTYAEAGGWGRALVLEARRRQIPSAGLQHGFIYRSWLNYRHEADEMATEGVTMPFPAPTLTLTFDAFAAEHLRQFGHFPSASIRVTGSSKLDALIRDFSTSAETVAAGRRIAGVRDRDTIILVTTKQREARDVLPALVAAAATLPNTVLVIKPHPAETEGVYDDLTRGGARVRVLPTTAPLSPLLAASRALVTVNSTLAIDAAVAGVPALVIGLPNNLSPLVDAGALAGASTPAEIGTQLERILYDEGFRQQLERARREFVERYGLRADGRAAERAAEAVLEIASKEHN